MSDASNANPGASAASTPEGNRDLEEAICDDIEARHGSAANGLLLPREGELAISHHGGFLKADERRIQYQRISRNNGEPKEYAVRLDPEKESGYVVVQLP